MSNGKRGIMVKIAFFEVEPWESIFLKKAFPKDLLSFSTGKLTLQNVTKCKDAEILSVCIHSKVSEEILSRLPSLKLIATMSTGFDHIDLEACRKRSITVCNVPAYGENTVAEHTFALILGLSRKLVDAVERTKSGSFDLTGLRGFDLQGKTLGVVGCGKIGRQVVRIARGFEMKVLVYDVIKDHKLAQKLGFKYVNLEQLFKSSDIVTLHVPYNQHTHHLVNRKLFSLMKKGACIINTARGAVMDTAALIEALDAGKIAGAGLDVLEGEDALIEEIQLVKKEHLKKAERKILAEDYALLKRKNVIITPHNAFNTEEALRRILEVTIKNITGFKNKKYVNLVKL